MPYAPLNDHSTRIDRTPAAKNRNHRKRDCSAIVRQPYLHPHATSSLQWETSIDGFSESPSHYTPLQEERERKEHHHRVGTGGSGRIGEASWDSLPQDLRLFRLRRANSICVCGYGQIWGCSVLGDPGGPFFQRPVFFSLHSVSISLVYLLTPYLIRLTACVDVFVSLT